MPPTQLQTTTFTTIPSTTPQHLSPPDRLLLTHYLNLNQNLRLLATDPAAAPARQGRDYFALLDWLDSPHIQLALAAHDRAESRAHRTAAAAALADSLHAAPTHLERRRAATPLLRLATVPSRPKDVAPLHPDPAHSQPAPQITRPPATPAPHPSTPTPAAPGTPTFSAHDTPAARLAARAGAAAPYITNSHTSSSTAAAAAPTPDAPRPLSHPASHPPLRDTA